MSNYFWCRKCGGTFDPSYTYCPNCDGAVVIEQQERIAELEAEVQRLKKRIEIVSMAAPDPGTLRNMLRAMQNGEMTVSRGVELVAMWLAGNYSDDMLPPVREGLGEDEMPWDRIDALTKQCDALQIDVDRLCRAASNFWWTTPPRELPEDELRDIRLGVSLSPNSWCMTWQQRAGELGARALRAEDKCASLVEALEVLRPRVINEYDRLYISGVIAKVTP